MKLLDLLTALHQAAEKVNAEVRIADPDGTFNAGILTVESAGDGDVVIITEPIQDVEENPIEGRIILEP